MDLNGVIPANILPLDDDLSIDVEAYRRHVRHLSGVAGVVAITCNGHAAEVSSLDRAERRKAVALAAETINGKVPLISGVHADNHIQAVEYARDAKDEGADALLVFPLPALALGGSQEMAYRHVAELAGATGLPLVLFSYPEFTGMHYGLDTLARICSLEQVVAVKEWSLDLRKHEETRRVLHGLDHPVSLLTSFSTNLLPALASGADGILSGHGSVIADLQVRLLAAVRAHDLAEAERQYARIQALTRVVYRAPMANMYARMKEHLIMLGHELTPAVRPPLERVSEAERGQLRQALAEAGLLPTGAR
ncbi:dihydrodipicolinate synthase family protein [Amycolatopsis mongoliensis]|uniref:Dihydrodipicolinate synthase family protein n=1 Tax=Amycolatopsis mongoliensis TaxID=715475 RepID=A0A9Y2JNY6_9PSEU|nr:dihydrodipicolinate synthase family protein [Amycolatopsis sp. 4-36]WIY01195.1 dihydrodipicolinate synthase family protein [Amycolatopsis sp. 4-36]